MRGVGLALGDRVYGIGAELPPLNTPPAYGAAVQLGCGTITALLPAPVPAAFDAERRLLLAILPTGALRLDLELTPGVLDQIARRTKTGRVLARLIDMSPTAAKRLARHLPDMLEAALQSPRARPRRPGSDMPPGGLRIVAGVADPRYGLSAVTIVEHGGDFSRMLRCWLCTELLRQCKDGIRMDAVFWQVSEIVKLSPDRVRKSYYGGRKEFVRK